MKPTGQSQAFEKENPYAATAMRILNPEDPLTATTPQGRERAQVYATLAVAFEQRETRFDLERTIANHAQETA